MSSSQAFEDAFHKSAKAQLIVIGGRIDAANRAAGCLLIASADHSALVDSPLEAHFSDLEKIPDMSKGSVVLRLVNSGEKAPVACNVVFNRLSEACSLWELEPVWAEQLDESDSLAWMRHALDSATEGVVCLQRVSNVERGFDFVVRFANQTSRSFFLSNGLSIEGRRLRNVFSFFDQLDLDARFEEIGENGSLTFRKEVRYLEGSEATLAVRLTRSGEENYVLCFRDVTEECRIQSKLEKSANDLDRLSSEIPGVYFHLHISDEGEPSFPYISGKVAGLLGVEAEEVMRDPSKAMGCVCVEDLERVYEMLAVSCRNLNPIYLEYRVEASDGRRKWVSMKAIPERRNDQQILWYGIFEDVSLRKESEERLRMVSAAVEASSDFVLMADKNGQAVYHNNSFSSIVGYETVDQVNESGGISSLFHDRRVFDKILQETLEYGYWQGDVQANTRSNRILDIYFRSVSVEDDKGRVSAIVITGTDITHNKRRQNLLKRYNSVLKAQSEAATDGILVVNERGIVSNFNTRFCKIWSLPSSTMDVGRPDKIWRAAAAQLDDSEAFFERTMKISVDETETFKDVLEFTDGRTFERSSIPISSPMGESYGRVWFFHEITEQKRSEERLLATMREAEEANKAKGYFLANMSHEIRTPMNGIIGMTGLLMETPLEGEQQDYVDTIRASSEALLVVINDILDFSKIESGKLEIESIMFDLRDCIEEAIDTLAIQAAEKGLDMSYVFGDEVPSSLLGDPTRLRQVIVNLLGNAVKFTEKGGVSVRVDPFHLKDEDVILHFKIRDTGIGIPEDRIDRLFGSFSQVDASTTRKYGGTGLGLAISKNLAELMGGSMWVESEMGKGSTFHFTVSFRKAAFDFDLSGSALPNPLIDLRAAVVGHDDFSHEALLSQLASLGLHAEPVSNLDDIDRFLVGEKKADIVFVDTMAQGGNSAAVIKSMRGVAGCEKLPVVFTGRLGSIQLGDQADERTLTLLKPFKLASVRTRVMEATGRLAPRVKKVASASVLLGEQMPLSILLAEDNVVNQKVAKRLFKKLGYKIDVAPNGVEAVNAVAEHSYDLVFMDIQMPEMDGLEATRAIIDRWGEERPRIIALTANAMREDRENCFAVGMDGYLTKPFKPEDLKEIVTKTYRHLHEESQEKAVEPEA